RTIDGIDIGRLNSMFKIDFLRQYKEKISKLTDAGLIEIVDNHLKLTKKGILLMNEVAVEFV
ncbi:MAG: coproporphyrinogen III oxidase, partial [Nitrospirae bacterium]|nr:coproporphyrinogen III oxidase [Nitrospirota bacterium]